MGNTGCWVLAAPGKSADVVVGSFFEPILEGARFQQETVTKGTLHNDKANNNGKRRLQCAVAYFMCNRRW